MRGGCGGLLGDCDEQDGDVVVAAFGVGGVDEGLAGEVEAGGGAGEDGGDRGVVELAGEAVGGEQVEVAGLGGVGGDLREWSWVSCWRTPARRR